MSTREIPEPRTARRLKGHDGWIWTLAASPDGKLVAGGGYETDHRIHVWDPYSGEVIHTLSGHTSSVTSLVFLDDVHLLSTSHDGTMRLWDLRALQSRVVMQTNHSLRTCAVSTLGHLAVGGDRVLRIQRGASDDLVVEIETPEWWRASSFSPCGRKLVVGSTRGTFDYFMLDEHDQWKPQDVSWQRLNEWIHALAWTPEGQVLIGTGIGQLFLLDPASGSRQELVQMRHQESIRHLHFVGNFLVVGARYDTVNLVSKGRLSIYRWSDKHLLKTLPDFSNGIDATCPLDNARFLITSKPRQIDLPTDERYAPAVLDFGGPNFGLGPNTYILPPPEEWEPAED